MLQDGLVVSHHKLSDYYHKIDQSPFYIWSCLLDPQISYEGLKADYKSDVELTDFLEKSKTLLFSYYNHNYTQCGPMMSLTPSIASSSHNTPNSERMNFMQRYKRADCHNINKLNENFKLPTMDFDQCEPLSWWYSRQGQFPNLYRLV
ncbi:hypothetical protein AX16_002254 [Volvariella volvacea WC 439]|nr:hypothetical protein AX16_002254 [Volvariella volvacea WC 439]